MRRRGGVIEATVFTAAGVAILIGLGVWQLDRKVWKENLIATLDERLVRAPADLPPPDDWVRLTPGKDEYTRVKFPAEFLLGEGALIYTAGSAFRPDVQGPGYWVFAPARLTGGSIVVVDRGFVPYDRKDPASRAQGAPLGSIDIVGVMRWPETRGMFTPNDEPQNNVWFLRDQKAIAAVKKWDAPAPFYIEQESPVPPGGLPKPGKLIVSLPDNHLQYALTWFGLALGLAGVYVTWLAGRLRRKA
ncbi:MAG TPA: SURF1 family protein [Pseudolabrys sp.]